jgi:hypothetical protein
VRLTRAQLVGKTFLVDLLYVYVQVKNGTHSPSSIHIKFILHIMITLSVLAQSDIRARVWEQYTN